MPQIDDAQAVNANLPRSRRFFSRTSLNGKLWKSNPLAKLRPEAPIWLPGGRKYH
ncbi:MAG: hypothetical protein H7Z17_02610 [Fuerstia sp.]|nr:hypothetical protein [Fuerstiella sp.]